MVCDVIRVKLPKSVERNCSPQVAMTDALNSERLITAASRQSGAATPMLDAGRALYAEAVAAGNGSLDMVGVLRAIEARTMALAGADTRAAGTSLGLMPLTHSGDAGRC
jgi:3-hydroxyisobutyrate dehydrogenase